MPPSSLKTSENLDSIQQWLDVNLSDSLIPHKNDVIIVPELKGVYFWFMHPKAYNALNHFVNISPVSPKYSKKIDGENYDLVYLGTAGSRNNKNGINNGHLRERFNWHIHSNNSENHVVNGTMSTFRRTLAPLFSDDLIADDTQKRLDDYLRQYFKVFWIAYRGEFKDVKDRINQDEKLLINILRPIFNLKGNDNKKDANHITSKIKVRRNEVKKNTITGLGVKKK